jgi:hypothetical protein
MSAAVSRAARTAVRLGVPPLGEHGHRRALLRQAPGDGPADAAACARDQGGLSVEQRGHGRQSPVMRAASEG